uniref:Uncharacterized protein n=1 Tax=Aquila chrysaetos chrysaetos TaxID=223781 RepID=A0A663E3G4_AQUCH
QACCKPIRIAQPLQTLEAHCKPVASPLRTHWKPWKPVANVLQAHCKPNANSWQTPCKPIASPMQTHCKPLANPLQAYCKPIANPLQRNQNSSCSLPPRKAQRLAGASPHRSHPSRLSRTRRRSRRAPWPR